MSDRLAPQNPYPGATSLTDPDFQLSLSLARTHALFGLIIIMESMSFFLNTMITNKGTFNLFRKEFHNLIKWMVMENCDMSYLEVNV